MMKRIKIVLTVLALLVVCITGLFVFQTWKSNQSKTTAVVEQIQALNRWETASYTIEKVIDSGTSGNIFQQFLFGNRILLIAHGKVISGFDLSTFSANNVSVHGSSISITLPPPQILDTTIDNGKTRVYDRQQGILVSPDNNLESQALVSAQNAIKQAACTDNILMQAATNAKKQLTSLLTSLGFVTITITIPKGTC